MAKHKGIYKRGNIYWIRYAGLDGKIVFESSKSTKFKDAQALYNARKDEVNKGKRPETVRIKNYTFKQLSKQYYSWAEALADTKQRSFHTTKKYQIDIVAEKFGRLPLRSIGVKLLEGYQAELLETKKPATVNRYIRLIQHMFTKAYKWRMVEKAFNDHVHEVEMLEEENQRERFLNEAECQKLITACKATANNDLAAIVTIALNTGIRKQNILKMRWEQIDLENGLIRLEKTKNKKKHTLFINNVVWDTLKALNRQHKKRKLQGQDIAYVFFNPYTEKPYTDVRKCFKKALERAKIDDFHFHDTRHTRGSLLAMADVDPVTIKEELTHSRLSTTERYLHIAKEHRRKAANKVQVSGEKQRAA
jgi:integrase